MMNLLLILIPSTIIFKNIPNEIKVTIGGDGADELFGGYNHYARIHKLNQKYQQFRIILDLLPLEFFNNMFKNNVRVSKWINALNDLKNGICPSVQRYLTNWQCNEILISNKKLFFDKGINYSKNHILQKDIEGYLANDILVKLDHSSMLSSKEARSPFLCNEIYNFAKFICPTDLKFNSNERKIILKKRKKVLQIIFEFNRKQVQIDVKSIVYSNSFKEIFNELTKEKDEIFNNKFLQEHIQIKK